MMDHHHDGLRSVFTCMEAPVKMITAPSMQSNLWRHLDIKTTLPASMAAVVHQTDMQGT
jgi:hypothetical protein